MKEAKNYVLSSVGRDKHKKDGNLVVTCLPKRGRDKTISRSFIAISIFVVFFVIFSSSAKADGCCINPLGLNYFGNNLGDIFEGAESFCNDDLDISQNQCCPNPSSFYGQGYPPFPTNRNICIGQESSLTEPQMYYSNNVCLQVVFSNINVNGVIVDEYKPCETVCCCDIANTNDLFSSKQSSRYECDLVAQGGISTAVYDLSAIGANTCEQFCAEINNSHPNCVVTINPAYQQWYPNGCSPTDGTCPTDPQNSNDPADYLCTQANQCPLDADCASNAGCNELCISDGECNENCASMGCEPDPDCSTPTPQCSDGNDNDGDELIDYPQDTGCSSVDDNDETDLVGFCGDNIINNDEICDGTALNSQTCQLQGYTSGSLSCNQDCLSFNYNNCQAACGDGTINSPLGETCDPQANPTGCQNGFTCRLPNTPNQCTCQSPTTEICYDNVNNDPQEDSLIDCADSDCLSDNFRADCAIDGYVSSSEYCTWQYDVQNINNKKCCYNALDCNGDGTLETCLSEGQQCPTQETEFPPRTIRGRVVFAYFDEDGQIITVPYTTFLTDATDVLLTGRYKYELKVHPGAINPNGYFEFTEVPTGQNGAEYAVKAMHPDYFVGETGDFNLGTCIDFIVTDRRYSNGLCQGVINDLSCNSAINDLELWQCLYDAIYTTSQTTCEIVVDNYPACNYNSVYDVGDVVLYRIPLWSLSGHVYNAILESAEIINALVSDISPEGQLEPSSDTTDNNGVYSFIEQKEDSYTLRATKDGFVGEQRTVLLDEDLEDIDFYLQPTDCFFEFSASELTSVLFDGENKKMIVSWDGASFNCYDQAEYYTIYRWEAATPENKMIIANNIPADIAEDPMNFVFEDYAIESQKTYCYQIATGYNYPFNDWEYSVGLCTSTGSDVCMREGVGYQYCEDNVLFECDDNFVSLGTTCGAGTTCGIQHIPFDGDQYGCYEDRPENQNCINICNGPLGIFGSYDLPIVLPSGLEGSCADEYSYCYSSYSESTIDQFDECNSISSCYDFKTESSCAENKCLSRECEWQEDPRYTELGAGVCKEVDKNYQDCNLCNSELPEIIAGNNPEYPIFSHCDATRCSLYGDECFYDETGAGYEYKYFQEANPGGPLYPVKEHNDVALGACQNKKDVACIVYGTQQECESNSPVSTDVTWETGEKISGTNILTPSYDYLSIGTCKWVTEDDESFCIKDTDENNIWDCTSFGPNIDPYSCHLDNSFTQTEIAHLSTEKEIILNYFVDWTPNNYDFTEGDSTAYEGHKTQSCYVQSIENLVKNPGFEKRYLYYWQIPHESIGLSDEFSRGEHSAVFHPTETDSNLKTTEAIRLRGGTSYIVVASIKFIDGKDTENSEYSIKLINRVGTILAQSSEVSYTDFINNIIVFDDVSDMIEAVLPPLSASESSIVQSNILPPQNDFKLLYAYLPPMLGVGDEAFVQMEKSFASSQDYPVYIDDVYLIPLEEDEDCYPTTISEIESGQIEEPNAQGAVKLRYFSEDGSHNLEPVKTTRLTIDPILDIDLIVDDSTTRQSSLNPETWVTDLSLYLGIKSDDYAICRSVFAEGTCTNSVLPQQVFPPSAEWANLGYTVATEFNYSFASLADGRYHFYFDCYDHVLNYVSDCKTIYLTADKRMIIEAPLDTIDHNEDVELKVRTKNPAICQIDADSEFGGEVFSSYLNEDSYLHSLTLDLIMPEDDRPLSQSFEIPVKCTLEDTYVELTRDIVFTVDMEPPVTQITYLTGEPQDITEWDTNNKEYQLYCQDPQIDDGTEEFGCLSIKHCQGYDCTPTTEVRDDSYDDLYFQNGASKSDDFTGLTEPEYFCTQSLDGEYLENDQILLHNEENKNCYLIGIDKTAPELSSIWTNDLQQIVNEEGILVIYNNPIDLSGDIKNYAQKAYTITQPKNFYKDYYNFRFDAKLRIDNPITGDNEILRFMESRDGLTYYKLSLVYDGSGFTSIRITGHTPTGSSEVVSRTLQTSVSSATVYDFYFDLQGENAVIYLDGFVYVFGKSLFNQEGFGFVHGKITVPSSALQLSDVRILDSEMVSSLVEAKYAIVQNADDEPQWNPILTFDPVDGGIFTEHNILFTENTLYSLRAYAKDDAENVGDTAKAIVVDRTGPVATEIFINGNSTTDWAEYGYDLTFDITLEDLEWTGVQDDPDVSATIKIFNEYGETIVYENMQHDENVLSRWSWTSEENSNCILDGSCEFTTGAYSAVFTGTDMFGNSRESYKTFFINDTAPPEIVIQITDRHDTNEVYNDPTHIPNPAFGYEAPYPYDLVEERKVVILDNIYTVRIRANEPLLDGVEQQLTFACGIYNYPVTDLRIVNDEENSHNNLLEGQLRIATGVTPSCINKETYEDATGVHDQIYFSGAILDHNGARAETSRFASGGYFWVDSKKPRAPEIVYPGTWNSPVYASLEDLKVTGFGFDNNGAIQSGQDIILLVGDSTDKSDFLSEYNYFDAESHGFSWIDRLDDITLGIDEETLDASLSHPHNSGQAGLLELQVLQAPSFWTVGRYIYFENSIAQRPSREYYRINNYQDRTFYANLTLNAPLTSNVDATNVIRLSNLNGPLGFFDFTFDALQDMNEGEYFVYTFAVDNNGLVSLYEEQKNKRRIIIDNTDPVLSNIVPPENSRLNPDSGLTLRFTLTDALSGADQNSVYVTLTRTDENNNEVTQNYDCGNNRCTLSADGKTLTFVVGILPQYLFEDYYVMTISASDKAGNSVFETINFALGDVPNVPIVRISGGIDEFDTFDSLDDEFIYTQEDRPNFTINFVGSAGRVLLVSSGIFNTIPTQMFSLTQAENTPYNQYALYYGPEITQAQVDNFVDLQESPIYGPNHLWLISSFSDADEGETAEIPVVYIVDRDAPYLKLKNRLVNKCVGLNLSGNYSDRYAYKMVLNSDSGILESSLDSANMPVQIPPNFVFDLDTQHCEHGYVENIRLYIHDKSGRVTSKEAEFVVDRLAPQVDTQSLSIPEYTSSNIAQLEGYVYDDNDGYFTQELFDTSTNMSSVDYVNITVLTPSNTVQTYRIMHSMIGSGANIGKFGQTINLAAEGTYQITIVPVDLAGNVGTIAVATISRDITGPIITPVSPTQNSVTPNLNQKIRARLLDLRGINCDETSMELRTSSTGFENVDASCSEESDGYFIEYTPAGEDILEDNKQYSVRVNTQDILGNPSSLVWNFGTDTSVPAEPQISLYDPDPINVDDIWPSTITLQNNGFVSASSSHNNLLLTYSQSVDTVAIQYTIGQGNQLSTTCTSQNPTNTQYLCQFEGQLAQQTYTITASARRVDNQITGQVTIVFTVDRNIPQVTILSPVEGETVNFVQTDVVVSVVDEHPGDIQISGDISPVVEDEAPFDESYQITLTPSSLGDEKEIIVTVADLAGNTRTVTRNIILDDVAPISAPVIHSSVPEGLGDNYPGIDTIAITQNNLRLVGSVALEENAKVKVTINNDDETSQTYDADSEGNFDFTIYFIDEVNIVTLEAYDEFGNGPGPETQITVAYLTRAPGFDYSVPVNNSIISGVSDNKIRVGLLQSPYAQIDYEHSEIVVKDSLGNNLEGELSYSNNELIFTKPTIFDDGRYFATILVRDRIGNEATYDITFLRDHTVPQIIMSPNIDSIYYTPEDSMMIGINITSLISLNMTLAQYAVDGVMHDEISSCFDNHCEFSVLIDLSTDSRKDFELWAESENGAQAYTGILQIVYDATNPSVIMLLAPETIDRTPKFKVELSEEAWCSYLSDIVNVEDNDDWNAIGNGRIYQQYQELEEQTFSYINTETSERPYIENQYFMEGNHSITVSCYDRAGNYDTQYREYEIINPRRNQVYYQQGDLVELRVPLYESTGINFVVDSQEGEINPDENDEELLVDNLGGGIYKLRYNISNSVVGVPEHPVITIDATSGTDEVSILPEPVQMYLSIHSANGWTNDEVYNAVNCFTGDAGVYFDEDDCLWNDVRFTISARTDANTNSCTMSQDDTSCSNEICKFKYYECRNNLGMQSASDFVDPNGISSTVIADNGKNVYAYYTQNVEENGDLVVWFTSTERITKTGFPLSVGVDIDTMSGINMQGLPFDVYQNGALVTQGKEVIYNEGQGLFFYKYVGANLNNQYSDIKFVIHDVSLSTTQDSNVLVLLWAENRADLTFDMVAAGQAGEELSLPQYCTDRVDNDLDSAALNGKWSGSFDCLDTGCAGIGGCSQTLGTEAGLCNDLTDNDGDGYIINALSSIYAYTGNYGFIDCQDTDCFQSGANCSSTETNCNDQINNDYDYGTLGEQGINISFQDRTLQHPEYVSLTDCADYDCNNVQIDNNPIARCEYGTELTCDDGNDNDGDGPFDCVVDGNVFETDCDRTNTQENNRPYVCPWIETQQQSGSIITGACLDRNDNDMDGTIDCLDRDCNMTQGSPSGQFCVFGNETFTGGLYTCTDGFDNDADTRLDCFDSDCPRGNNTCGPCPTRENYRIDACADGIDNDANGKIDCLDSTCIGAMGPEGKVCVSQSNELGIGMCSDGIDNDGTGGADCADSDCVNTISCRARTATIEQNQIVTTYDSYVNIGRVMHVTYIKQGLNRQNVDLILGSVAGGNINQISDPSYTYTPISFSDSLSDANKIWLTQENNVENLNVALNINVKNLSALIGQTKNLGLLTTFEGGGTSEGQISVFVAEATPPIINSVLTTTAGLKVKTKVDATDIAPGNSGIYGCRFIGQGFDNISTNCTFEHHYATFGPQTMTVQVIDGAGNVRERLESFNLTSGPTPGEIYPFFEAGYPVRDHMAKGHISVFGSDFYSVNGFNDEPECNVVIRRNGQIVQEYLSDYYSTSFFNVTCIGSIVVPDNMADGFYTVSVEARDSAGKIGKTVEEPLWICLTKFENGRYVCMDSCEQEYGEINVEIERPPYTPEEGWPYPYRSNMTSANISGSISRANPDENGQDYNGLQLALVRYYEDNMGVPRMNSIQGYPDINGYFEFNTPLADGENSMMVDVIAGGVGTKDVNLTKDKTGPSVVTFLPGDMTTTSTPLLDITLDELASSCTVDIENYHAYDRPMTLVDMNMTDNLSATKSNHFTYQVTSGTPFSAGQSVTVRFNCIDIFGNLGINTYNVVFDPARVFLQLSSSYGTIETQNADYVKYLIDHKVDDLITTQLVATDQNNDNLRCEYTCNGDCQDNSQQVFGVATFAHNQTENIIFDDNYIEGNNPGMPAGTFVYNVTCWDNAGYRDSNIIEIEIDLGNLNVVDYGPRGYFTGNNVILYLATSYESRCQYSNSAMPPPGSQFSQQNNYVLNHTIPLTLTTSTDSFTYYVYCIPEYMTENNYIEQTITFTRDNAPPSYLRVDSEAVQCNLDSLSAEWEAQDDGSGISHFRYAIGTATTGTAQTSISNWTNTTDTSETVSGLNLPNNVRYFWSVYAYDQVGFNIVSYSNGTYTSLASCTPTCTDARQNQGETDIDCGGPHCGPCDIGESCTNISDCSVGECISGECNYPHCQNDIFDINIETDIDCGRECPACDNGLDCRINTDCESGYCTSSRLCAEPSCNDGVKNGAESDTDCGGAECDSCQNDDSCTIGSDCISNSCQNTICAAPSCSDGIRSPGFESGIDCGISCEECEIGETCVNNDDCESGNCKYSICSEPIPADQVDSDGDGMPDMWEIEHGLDPDVDDSELDPDGDLLINIAEYQESTHPNNADTDGDTFKDGLELSEQTDPLDADSFPKGHFWSLLLLLVSIIVLLGGGGYLGYKEYLKKTGKGGFGAIGGSRPGSSYSTMSSARNSGAGGLNQTRSSVGGLLGGKKQVQSSDMQKMLGINQGTVATQYPQGMMQRVKSKFVTDIEDKRKKEREELFSKFDTKDSVATIKNKDEEKTKQQKSQTEIKAELKSGKEDVEKAIEWLTLSQVKNSKHKDVVEDVLKDDLWQKLGKLSEHKSLKADIKNATTKDDRDDVFEKLRKKMDILPENLNDKQKKDAFESLKKIIVKPSSELSKKTVMQKSSAEVKKELDVLAKDKSGSTKYEQKNNELLKEDIFSKLKHAVPIRQEGDVFEKIKSQIAKKGETSEDIFAKLKKEADSKKTSKISNLQKK